MIPRAKDDPDWARTKELVVGLLAYQLMAESPTLTEHQALLAAKTDLLRLRPRDVTAKRVLELCVHASERTRRREGGRHYGTPGGAT